MSEDIRCQVEIPGLGQCEVDQGQHKFDGLGREIHVVGACSWNGGTLIEVSDRALAEQERMVREGERRRADDAGHKQYGGHKRSR